MKTIHRGLMDLVNAHAAHRLKEAELNAEVRREELAVSMRIRAVEFAEERQKHSGAVMDVLKVAKVYARFLHNKTEPLQDVAEAQMPEVLKERYLGDNVHVQFDGVTLAIWATPRSTHDVSNTIYLAPPMQVALVEFIEEAVINEE